MMLTIFQRRQKLQKEVEKIKEETDMHLSAMGVKVSKGGDVNKQDDVAKNL